MRVFKKISTPFEKSNPTRAIIVVNAIDSQLNTVSAYIQACEDKKIPYIVYVNKIDAKDEYRVPEIEHTREWFAKQLNQKEIEWGSLKTGEGIDRIKKHIELWKGERIIILGIFNSGKTSLINYLCGTDYRTDDIPGTTLEFKETEIKDGTVIIDSIGQLIDIHKPMMVSVDFSDCSDSYEKIQKVFTEEIRGIIETKEIAVVTTRYGVNLIKKQLKLGGKLIIIGAGASALVAREMAGQGTECGLPILLFTNDGSEVQPVTFSKGLGEQEGGLSKYISHTVNKNDIVIGVSASGGTGFVFDTMRIAQEKGAKTIAITENSDTRMGKYADVMIKSDAKPEGPSSSKIQTAHLVIGHALILTVADDIGVTADESIGHMLPEKLDNKKMGIK